MTEIMAPVGSYESLAAAIKAGAGSVYFGIDKLNMRSRAANNFTTEDLKKIVKICKKENIKTYLALNTVMYDEDLKLMQDICNLAKEVGLTAIIASDISAISYAKSINLEVHISTQANVSNLEAVKFYSKYADVIVLARELTLEQIKNIISEIKNQKITGPSGNLVQIEIFIHGALCVSISGICYMSLAQYNHSANRGDCLQACRRTYKITDEETGDELKIDNKFVMSPKDLCTIGMIDKIIESGVKVLKIEGRGRSPEYVYTTVKTYKEAIDSCHNKTYTKTKINKWRSELEKVFNRGFWDNGYYLGKKTGEWSGTYGSRATQKKEFLGTVKNYFQKAKVGLFQLETGSVKVGDQILITGPTTGVIKTKVESIIVDEKKVKSAGKGDSITIPISEKIRKNDKLYVLVKSN